MRCVVAAGALAYISYVCEHLQSELNMDQCTSGKNPLHILKGNGNLMHIYAESAAQRVPHACRVTAMPASHM